jgi:hypothetical protein
LVPTTPALPLIVPTIPFVEISRMKKLSQVILSTLVNTSIDFNEAVPQQVNARRAKRLVQKSHCAWNRFGEQ